MLLLKTKWGNYLLHNVVFYDVYPEKDGKKFCVHFAVENKKVPLLWFEDWNEALLFSSKVLQKITHDLIGSGGDNLCELELSKVCDISLTEILEGGKNENNKNGTKQP